MSSLSLIRVNRTSPSSFKNMFSGVLLFAMSDIIVGVHLFGGNNNII